jgi:hypothetical protein
MVGVGLVPGPATAVSVALIAIGAGMFFIGMLLPTLTEFQVGLGGFSAKLRQRDEEVQATLSPESEGLLKIAVQLAGGEKSGEELLEQALIETYMRWSRAKREGPAEAVRAQLFDLVSSPARAAASAQGKPR